MVNATRDQRPHRDVYKVYLSLLPQEWEKLRYEAEKRHVTGREVIESTLSRALSAWPTPPKRAPEAPQLSAEEVSFLETGQDG